ncbi:MAG TPA: protocatechuate 3,4-dioxygenase subunit alpha [Marmoricola sp.]
MSSLVPTGGQTIGPFFGYALPYDGGEMLVPTSHPDAIELTGVVYDGHGQAIPDALVEIWQADAEGAVVQRPGSLHRNPHDFTGWGRCPTDAAGRYRFTTIRPGGAVPFFAITLFARGLTNRLFTRAYLPGATDDLLASVSVGRRETLIVVDEGATLRFDIHMQGDDETVFLSYPGHLR